MSLLFTEGFDWGAGDVDAITYGKWLSRGNNNSFNNAAAVVRFPTGSGKYWTFTSRGATLLRAIGSNLVSGCIGVAFRTDFMSGATPYKATLLSLLDGTSTVQIGLLLNNDLTISIFRSTHSSILGTTTATLVAGQWHYIELKWTISDSISSGQVKLYVDAIEVLDLSAGTDTAATANLYASHYCLFGNLPSITSPGTSTCYMDDHYLIDFNGSTNNTPLGNIRIQSLFPDGNGNSSQWIGSDGNSTNNYQNVDETQISTTDYNESLTVGHSDTYTTGDTVATTSTVYGVVTNLVALKTDTGARLISDVIRTSAVDYPGSAITLTTSYTNYQTVHETNPGTGVAWTKTNLDSAEFGIKIDS